MHHPSLYRASSSNSLAISSNLDALLDYDEQHRRQESGSSLPERQPSSTPFIHNEFATKGLPPPPRGPRKPRSRSTILTQNENVLASAASIYGSQEQGVDGQEESSSMTVGETWRRWGSGATQNPFINPAPSGAPRGGPASLRSVSTKPSSEGTICDIDERPQSVLSSISSTSFMQGRHISASTPLRPHSPSKPDTSSRDQVAETDRPSSSLSFASSFKSVARSTTPQHGDVGDLRRPPVELRQEMLSPPPSEKPFGQLHRLLSKVGIFDGLHANERTPRHPHPQAAEGARKEGHLDIGLLRLRGRKRHKEKALDMGETVAVEDGGTLSVHAHDLRLHIYCNIYRISALRRIMQQYGRLQMS